MNEYLLMFLFGLVFDTLWVICIDCTNKRRQGRKRHLAAATGIAITGMTALSGALIAKDNWLIIPELVGVSIGMYLGMYVADVIDDRTAE